MLKNNTFKIKKIFIFNSYLTLIKLIKNFLKLEFNKILNILGFRGAKELGNIANLNSQLKLNQNYPLGKKGTLIQIPKDKVIFDAVKLRGQWGTEESIYLAKFLQEFPKALLIDVGANCGLISLATLNIANQMNDVILVEPIARHVEAIEFNLRKISNKSIYPFALGSKKYEQVLYTNLDNFGGTTKYKSITSLDNFSQTTVTFIESKNFFTDVTNNYESVVLKIDTEGMEPEILSSITSDVWGKFKAGIIEVFAMSEIQEFQVNVVVELLNEMFDLSWSSDFAKNINVGEVRDFWLSKNNGIRNLYFKCK